FRGNTAADLRGRLKPTNSERWTRIQELFHSALERAPTERATFLAASCGDDTSLLIEVEALLAADDEASGFLEHDRDRPAQPLEPGHSFGSYRILGLIGRGGMGEVYRARDTRLEREVAIKVLARRGTVVVFQDVLERDAQTLSRFEREALLTASVQHPAVVPIYERGELPDGRPFYAMKLVGGRSLRELIEERKTLADRMALLPNVIAVAEALAHAHWQRVVHRDVKPSNVIVGEFGETVLIDWGLAKSLS